MCCVSPGQPCPFVLLVLSGQLDDLRVALLASLMDVIGLRYAQDSLSNSMSWADGLSRLHCHPRGEHLLSLLGQNCKDTGQDTAKVNLFFICRTFCLFIIIPLFIYLSPSLFLVAGTLSIFSFQCLCPPFNLSSLFSLSLFIH